MNEAEVSLRIKRMVRGVRVEAELFIPAMNIALINDGNRRIFSFDEFKKTMDKIDIEDSIFAIIHKDMLELSEKLDHELSRA